jgi:kinesin family protein 2/24
MNHSSTDEEDTATRRMFDKRELRKRNKDAFEQQVTLWRTQHAHHSGPTSEAELSNVRVFVRKRPLFDYERHADEIDVLTVRGGAELVVHNCLTKADLRSLFVSHMGFQFARAFGETAADDEVYDHCAAPAVGHVQQGGVATLFMFGQTGSGKTHTISAVLRRTSDQLFSPPSNEQGPTVFGLVAFEIAGRSMRDLLDASAVQKDLKIMEDKDRRTRVLGLRVCEVHSAEELISLVQGAMSSRTTRATRVNDVSSRSHAVVRIWHRSLSRTGDSNIVDSYGGIPAGAAVLTLVDCAGSERREDSAHHDAQSRKAAAEINSTIFALKECFRVMRAPRGQQPPFRESLLTRVLSDSFSSGQALNVAIGTVSPSATDTEHSIGTLRALQQLQGTSMSFETRDDVSVKVKHCEPHPRSWSDADVRQWLESAAGGDGRCHSAALSKGTDGKIIVRWPVQRFIMLCGGD